MIGYDVPSALPSNVSWYVVPSAAVPSSDHFMLSFVPASTCSVSCWGGRRSFDFEVSSFHVPSQPLLFDSCATHAVAHHNVMPTRAKINLRIKKPPSSGGSHYTDPSSRRSESE